jgi:hypothetical protein
VTSTEFYMLIDCTGVIAVAVMLYLTEALMPGPNELEQKVHSNLDSAVDNGYDVTGWTAEDIVADLRAFAVELEDYSDEALLPHVVTWKTARNPER